MKDNKHHVTHTASINEKIGYANNDAFHYGRKKGRIDPKASAKQSRKYGMPTTIFTSSLNHANINSKNQLKEKFTKNIIEFKNLDILKLDFTSKDLPTIEKIIKFVSGVNNIDLVKTKNGYTFNMFNDSARYIVVIKNKDDVFYTKITATLKKKHFVNIGHSKNNKE